MQRMAFGLLAIVTLLGGCARASGLRSPTATDDPRIEARIDSLFAAFGPETPGCAVGVYRAGRMVFAKGYGMADLERRVPITPRTVFDIGSVSKQFTAAAIVLLAQQGKLSLDDDVRRFVPELPVYEDTVTVRHLLHHTSGLADYSGLLRVSGVRYDDVSTPAQALAAIARQRTLQFRPGTRHQYNNSGYFLSSLIVERVTGQSLREFARAQLFEPLGMSATQFLGSYDDLVRDRALAYSSRATGELRTDLPRWLQLGDGAVLTTVEDLLRWDQQFFHPTVGGAPFVATMETLGRLNDGTPLRYALGLYVSEYRGARIVHHGGAWGGYRADLLRFPEHRFSVAVLCNFGDLQPDLLTRAIADVYLDAVLQPLAVHTTASPASAEQGIVLSAEQLSHFAGTYAVDANGRFRTFAVRENQLVEVDGTQVYPLTARGNDRFDDPQIEVQFSADAARAEITIKQTGQRIPITRYEQDATPHELSTIAGRYVNDQLDVVWTLVARPTGLVLEFRNGEQHPLDRGAVDGYVARTFGAVMLELQRDSSHAVTHFVAHAGPLGRLVFRRMDVPLR
jgi:CubicO group peptidase (beta-lactamase class C family)